jgi:(heptosyl)LPS beta-1,4-glucosyltransferase
MKISAVLIVKNEEKNIEDALKSLTFADEIIVIDDSSTDKTVQLAKKHTKKIYSVKGEGYVEPLREFAIKKATYDWIFLLDGDERIPESLAKKLVSIPEDTAAVSLPRKNIIFGTWIQHAGWWPDYNIRFFRKDRVRWSSRIHSQPEVHGKKEVLNPTEENALVHYNYTSVTQFIDKLNTYTTFQADSLIQGGYTFHWQDVLTSAMNEFLSRYFAQEGFKEGLHGLALSLLMAFYMLVVYLKVWDKQGFKPEASHSLLPQVYHEWRKGHQELAYWFYTSLLTTSKNPLKKMKYSLLRKNVSRKLPTK